MFGTNFLEKITKRRYASSEIHEDFTQIHLHLVDSHNIDEKVAAIIAQIKQGINVNYLSDDKFCRKHKIRNAGPETYVIYPLSAKKSFSKRYGKCVGYQLVGVAKKNNILLSSMAHLNPGNISFSQIQKKFVKDLRGSMKDAKRKLKEKSISVGIFGGLGTENVAHYRDLIKLLGKIFKEELGFEPTVLTGPNCPSEELVNKEDIHQTDAYFDISEMDLYIVRPAQRDPKLDKPYLPHEINDKIIEWGLTSAIVVND